MNTPFPRWIRLTRAGQTQVNRVWRSAYQGPLQAHPEAWLFFNDIVDFREACARTSRIQDWRTRIVRALLWAAERLSR